MPIKIEQEMARIGVRTTRAKMTIEHSHPRMKIVRNPALANKMSAKTTKPTMHVDWVEVRNRIFHVKQGSSFVIDLGEQATQDVLGYNMEAVEDGNRMAAIHLPGNPVAEIARQKMTQDMPEINVNPVPQPMPQIDWTPGSLTIDWNNQQLEIEWEGIERPTVHVEPHSVEIFLRNRNSVKISFVPDGNFPGEKRKVDAEA